MSLLETFTNAISGMFSAEDGERCEQSLAEFVRQAWAIIDPGNPLVWGPSMDAICEHLEAVQDGYITRLLMTVPPGFSKSTITNVCFPAWSWARQPHLRFICTSYSEGLTRHNNNRCRHIIADGWYQQTWGKKYTLQAPNRPDLMSNDHLGWILATSVGGQLLGWRGDRVILDDPNSPQVESQAVRLTTNRWFHEVVPSRLNDMAKSAIIVIQQRMHMEDVVGTALGSDVPWVHCNIPMEYEPRAYVNGWRAGSAMIESFFDDEVDECSELFWADWRTEDGELAWPARFPVTTLVQMKASMGPTAIAAQLQQHPIPRGGAIIKRDWWQVWPTNDAFPPLSYIVAALDTAYTADTSNDPSAMTIWGVNKDEYDNPRLFLLWAWQEWLELHDLVEKVIDICQVDKRPVTGPRFPVDRLLIEDATVGKSVNQELDRILRQRMTFGIDLCNPRNYGGDKTARMYSIEHVFSQKMVYAHERSWSEKVIDQCASVPYCPTLDQRVLTSDLQWVEAASLRPGDKVVGFDEYPLRDDGLRKRGYRQALVERNIPIKLHVIRLEMSDGSYVRAAVDHPWLISTVASRNQRWATCEQIVATLRRGFSVHLNKYVAPWTCALSREAGWLAGIFDGEGYLSPGKSGGLGIVQNPGLVQNEILGQLCGFGFQAGIYAKDDGRELLCRTTRVLGGWPERLRLLGSVRPIRLLEKFTTWFGEGGTWQMECWDRPLKVMQYYDEGEQWCAGLQTSSRTYLCEGFAAHNTSDDHLADTVAMAVRWLRDCGYAPKREEVAEEYLSLRTFKPRLKPLYPGNSAR